MVQILQGDAQVTDARAIAGMINDAYNADQFEQGKGPLYLENPLPNLPMTPNTGLAYKPMQNPSDPFVMMQLLRQMVGPVGGGRT